MRRSWAFAAAGAIATSLLILPSSPAYADSVRDSEWMVDALKLPEAHKIATGEGVTVGIVDTGIDSTHPDLTGVVVAGKDSWSPAGDGQTDATGHGTAMASLVAGHGHGVDGSEGVLGVAPGAKILSYGAWREGDDEYNDAELEKGLRWVLDNGADVILLAYGGGTSTPTEEALIDEALGKGIPVIAPTRNASAGQRSIGFPGLYEGVTLVGCTDSKGDYSDVGLTAPEVSVAAPCEDLTSASTGGGYNDISGTSKAGAVVAGTYALVRSHWPDISLKDMHRKIFFTADDKLAPGRDAYLGYGVINPVNALTVAVDPVDPANPPHPVADPIYSSAQSEATASEPSKDSGTWTVVAVVAASIVVIGSILLVVLRRRRA